MSKRLPNEDWERIGARYLAGETTSDLALEYKIGKSTISWRLNKNGIQLRPKGHKLKCKNGMPAYTCNHNFFDSIDTEIKAYFLGLMASDGCVHSNKTSFEIGLSGEEDRCVIERFKSELEYNGNIYCKIPNYIGAKTHYRITVSSKRNVENLIRLGITPRKSLTLKFPDHSQVPEHLMRHFIRGYFDGDGSASFRKSGDFLLSVISSSLFVESLHKYMIDNLGLNSHIEYRNSKTASIKIGGNYVSLIFLDWIYRDATIFLPRKEEKYRICKSVVEKRLSRVENLYNVRSHVKTMENAKQCAKILGINLPLEEWNGLSISKIEQDDIIDLYARGYGVKNIMNMRNCSHTLVQNVLKRNGITIRGVTAQSIAQKRLLISS